MQGVAKLIISVFLYVAEQERELIKERQKQGYNALKKNDKGKMISNRTGEVIGRKGKILTAEQIKLLKEFKAGKSALNISQLARMLEVSRPFIYKKLSEL